MKFLRNPWIVGLLGLAAMVVLVSQTLHPRWTPPSIPNTAPRSPVVDINSPPPMPGANVSPHAAQTAVAIDRDYLKAHFMEWISPTQRDPFFLATPPTAVSTNLMIHQLSQLKLKAIWRQDGVSMVAINKGIYRVGDNVGGGVLRRIDKNGVWLEANGQKEFVVFDNPDRQSSTNELESP